MNYTWDVDGIYYVGTGNTLREAISDAVTKFAAGQFSDLASARAWCIRFVRAEVSRRKQIIFSAASNYDTVELFELMVEARDYRITSNTAAARYPLANALATAKGVTMVSLLTAWGNALQTAFTQLATLIDRQDRAETAINAAQTSVALIDVMTNILEALA